MPVRKLRRADLRTASRAVTRVGIATSLLILGCESLQNAVAEGDTRTIALHHMHTGEDLTITYKRNGRYDEDALKKVNWILRDWRRNEDVRMDPRLIDLVWEVQRDVGASKEAIQIVCGYRASGTNEMLRRRSRNSGVARFSQHTLGKAMDFYIPNAKLEDVRAAGLRLQRGGVGFYPTSGSPFVHLDVGSVRHWPRMTHDQLVKVFPDGRTVHVPSDGQPLAGYALALADIEKRGGEPSATSLMAARSSGVNTGEKRGLLSRLFGFGKTKSADDEDDTPDAPAATAQAPVQTAQAVPLRAKPIPTEALRKPEPVAAAMMMPVMPLPKARPATAQVARAEPAPVAQPAGVYRVAAAEPADGAEIAPTRPQRIALAEPKATGSIGPWPAPPTLKDRVGGDTLGYAVPNDPKIVRQAPVTAPIRPTVSSGGMTIAVKTSGDTDLAIPAPRRSAPMSIGQRFDDLWMRAVMLAPNLRSYMTMTVWGDTDMRTMRSFMERPVQAVAMTFSDDPHQGMRADTFGGNAITFVATTTFANRTASLR